MSILAFIPARGGSKEIPRKNLYPILGKPLLQYTIEAARESKFVSDIFISSEDTEIISFCKSMGMEVPYTRPLALAQDTSSTVDVVIDALEWMQKNKEGKDIPEDLLLLQATSPLRTARDIDKALEFYFKKRLESLVSVNKMLSHPCDCLVWEKNDWTYLVEPPEGATRRQDYSQIYYALNGCIFIIKTSRFLEKKAFLIKGKTKLYEMPPERSIDIDEMLDIRLAEACLRAE